MDQYDIWKTVLDNTTCPHCKAPPGQPCRGRDQGPTHDRRQDAATRTWIVLEIDPMRERP